MAPQGRDHEGPTLAAVTTAMVRLHREHYGRGPKRARTVMAGDVLTCVLEEGFTTVERTLLDRGEHEAVFLQRRRFQQALRPTFISTVEQLTARTVRAFLSQVHVDPDMAIEVFILEPAPHG